MPRTRLGGGSSRDRQGGALSADTPRLGIDTDVFELLSIDQGHEMAQPEPRIERWLNCWRNP
ncbi:hypothetical protein Har1130_04960 [Haloarcula sp. CBA1130]|uniref:hypothetical protein n=1 Tax=unclassified Haloarcula TaxID=2624677 RepID=UPI00124575AF|nr:MULTISPECIES: hypothetical protein [unclassified Haloarcula]KAA9398192.1 hypothetical protein Har1129_08180 [Haloarcula sp. CBA1129]KAA9402121.1 hypothetical protein Har1130_04960 [Haloarcula sp. CBA1130]